MSVAESNVERKREQSLMEGGATLYVCVASGARTRRITNFTAPPALVDLAKPRPA